MSIIMVMFPIFIPNNAACIIMTSTVRLFATWLVKSVVAVVLR